MGKIRMALAATAALALGPGAGATVHDLTLTGSVADFSSGSFSLPGLVTLGFGNLPLSGLPTGLVLEAGDTVNFTVTLDGVFTVPASLEVMGFGQFFGFNLPGVDDTDGAEVTGEFSAFTDLVGTIPVPVGGGCGNCLSLITGNPDTTAWSFTGFSGSFTVLTLDTPFEVTEAQISYQVTLEDLTGGVIPEPATWALLVSGFGLVGAGLRRQRREAMHSPS
jgi:hypothetical protein